MEVEPLPPWPSIGRMFADNAARFGDASAIVGGVIVPISSRLKVLEAGPILERTGAKILFTVAECAGARFIDSLHETYGTELTGLPALKRVVQLDEGDSFDAFLDSGRS